MDPARKPIGNGVIELVMGDITEQDTDAIVNAANRTLLGGGGVDGAIHRAGGPEVLKECRELGGCDTGDAKPTTAGRMQAECVVHTVGPVYRDGDHGEPRQLASCHRRSLEVALDRGARSIAFPAISCGVYGYPVEDAAKIAIQTVAQFLREHEGIELVRFVLFDETAFHAYSEALAALET